ncbi:hypothetical protein LSS_17820 [Leptospira santarosai serovar Shermani str. LT 821]|uniref:Uncharacterized protein n=1 Tax=Leptospira santarosai serovar Shermani str. LT 821 TaxID=758847 RepID=K8Y3V5_9LEPT|nr:hypothetical protein LSS_17820 [Leptospira santarosai serovar Shermani str. LT 821]
MYAFSLSFCLSFSEKDDKNFCFYFLEILQKTPNGNGDSCDRFFEKF